MQKIHLMALRHSAFYSPYLLTIAGGYLRDEGLEPVYRVATPQDTVAQAMAQETCDVAQSAVATSFAALERGESLDTGHFAAINNRDGFFLVSRAPISQFSWDALRGTSVLVDHFFQPYAMLRFSLSRNGMDYSDFVVIDVGDVYAMERAFRAGQGDFVQLQGPQAQQLEKDGVGFIVAAIGDAIGPVAFSSLLARKDWLSSDMAKAFMRAYHRAMAFAISAPAAEIAAIEMSAGLFPGIDEQILAQTVAAYKTLGCWSNKVEISRASYERLLDVFIYNGTITRRHAYASVIYGSEG